MVVIGCFVHSKNVKNKCNKGISLRHLLSQRSLKLLTLKTEKQFWRQIDW